MIVISPEFISNPILSVTVVTYNHENYLAQTLDGILMQQTAYPFEIIIGEDCSTDKTREICLDYQKRYPHAIKLILHETNQGRVANFMAVANEIRGEYVAEIAGDDYWIDPLKLQKQMDYMVSHLECGLCVTKAQTYIQNEQRLGDVVGNNDVEDYARLMMNRIDMVAPTALYRRSIKEKAEEAIVKTYDDPTDSMVVYWIAYYSKIKFFDEITTVYRVLPNSECHSNDPIKSLYYETRYTKGKLKFLLEHPVPEEDAVKVATQILKEYDDDIAFAKHVGEDIVRASKVYKLGKQIKKIFGRK